MRYAHRPLHEGAARSATSMSKQYADEMVLMVEKFEWDSQSKERRSAGMCATCFYLRGGRIGGSAITAWTCGLCASEQMAASTAVDRLCNECAINHQLCVQCGGDSEMRVRRRKWPKPVAAASSSSIQEGRDND